MRRPLFRAGVERLLCYDHSPRANQSVAGSVSHDLHQMALEGSRTRRMSEKGNPQELEQKPTTKRTLQASVRSQTF